MKLVCTILFALSFLNAGAIQTPVTLTVGPVDRAFTYRLASADGKVLKIRRLVFTDWISASAKTNNTQEFYSFYEGFERQDINDNGVFDSTVNAVSYFGVDGSVLFDQAVDISKKHIADLSYPENSDVEVEIDSNGFPQIKNIVLSRSEDEMSLTFSRLNISYSFDRAVVSGVRLVFSKESDGTVSKTPTSSTPVNDIYLRQ